MGELIAGVGDEVLLFGTFLTLAACFYVGILIYKSRSNRQNAEEVVQQGSSREGTTPPSAATQSNFAPHDTASSLRSRFNPSSTGSEPTQAGNQPSFGQEETPESDNTLISVRLIKSANDSLTVRVNPSTTLRQIRSSYFTEESAESRLVSFIFRGRVLNDDTVSLLSLGITDGQALHVHVGRPRPESEDLGAGPEPIQELDLSRLFVPLFGIILGIVWVSMLMYPNVFNFVTKLFLFLLSIGYVLLTYVTAFS